MKIIHCADIHLDSKLSANLDSERARERRAEILNTYVKMVDYAEQNDVDAILISGDLFDIRRISAGARNTVYGSIEKHPNIDFYYLKGNHDDDNFLDSMENIPENLHLFDKNWKEYKRGKVSIFGLELNEENSQTAPMTLVADVERINIVMLHGQISESAVKDKAEIINLNEYRNKGIDYMALGHIHSYKNEKLDERTTYCYPGCLEGRGFDECGEHGVVLLTIDEETHSVKSEFVPLAKRHLYEVHVDVTGCMDTLAIADRMKERLTEENISEKDLVKIVLTGFVNVECEKNPEYLLTTVRDDYYFVKIYDETSLEVNIEDFRLDQSLKGEFVRNVLADESMDEDEKNTIIRYGLQALAGEEIG